MRGPGALPRAQASAAPALRARPVPAVRLRACRSGVGAIRRPGRDLTIVTWGATVEKSLAGRASARADDSDAEVEVIDLRTIVPWDRDLVGESRCAAPTGSLVVHEDVLTCGLRRRGRGLGGRRSSSTDLEAPIRRVAALDTHVAYEPTLEEAILPQVDDILAAITATLP